MLAGIFRGSKRLSIEEYKLRELKTNELLIEVGYCGICGTDFHIVEGSAPSKPPVIIGHEYSGKIVEINNRIDGFNVDDQVVIDPNIHCGYCEYCKRGKINHCRNLRALGVTENGGLAQYSIVPASQAYLVPKDFSLQSAAFTEPLSCCVHGINRSDIKTADKVAIVGAGPIGLLMLQLVRLNGASKVVIIEPTAEKRKIAKELGADLIFDSNDVGFINELIELTSGGVDVVFECVGNADASQTSVRIVKKSGTVLLFGLPDQTAALSLNLQSLFHKEISLNTSLLNPFTYQTAVDLLVSGKVSVAKFNPARIAFENEKLSSLFNNGKDNSVIKYIVLPNN